MHEFKIEQGNETYKIDIENYKFIVGKNFFIKHKIYLLFKNYFSKIGNSDFAFNARYKRMCYFDEKPLDLKLWKYFEITPYFDLETDLKMGTKSLLTKYLESFSDEFECNECFTTLSTLLSSLNDDFFSSETSIEFGDKKLSLYLGEISKNILFKEVYPIISCEDSDCNSADLSYEELIILQICLLEKIVSKLNNCYYFINAIIPQLTPNILKRIIGFRYSNCFIVINTESLPNINYQDVYLCNKTIIDFANDDSIIENINDFPFHIEKEELLAAVQEYLSFRKQNDSNKNIVELFTK